MATKNLARTAIEGGRYSRNQLERKESTRAERAATRDWFASRAFGDGGVAPRRQPVDQEFHDRLAAPERWLRAQCGRRWNDVHHDLVCRFNTRTIAGRHIVYDHLLQWVRETDLGEPWRGEIVAVDEVGVLREIDRPRHRVDWPRPTVMPAALAAFVDGRRIGKRGAIWFWFVSGARSRSTTCVHPGCKLPHYCVGQVYMHVAAAGYRQDRRLDEDEVEFWEALRDDEREPHTHSTE